jgi:hypothetical protein
MTRATADKVKPPPHDGRFLPWLRAKPPSIFAPPGASREQCCRKFQFDFHVTTPRRSHVEDALGYLLHQIGGIR